MKRKAFTLTLAAFLLVSLAACSSNETNSSKIANETVSAVETSVSENVHSDITHICQKFCRTTKLMKLWRASSTWTHRMFRR